MTKTTYRELLAILLEDYEMSLVEVAEMAGLPVSTLHTWRYSRPKSLQTANRFLRVLGYEASKDGTITPLEGVVKLIEMPPNTVIETGKRMKEEEHEY